MKQQSLSSFNSLSFILCSSQQIDLQHKLQHKHRKTNHIRTLLFKSSMSLRPKDTQGQDQIARYVDWLDKLFNKINVLK